MKTNNKTKNNTPVVIVKRPRRRDPVIARLEADIRYLRIVNAILSAMLIFVTVFSFVYVNTLNTRYNELQKVYTEIIEETRTGESAIALVDTEIQNVANPCTLPMVEPEMETVTTITVTTPVYNIPEIYEDIPLDDALKAYIISAANAEGIPEEILFSMAWRESMYDTDIVSKSDDHGLFQINRFNFKHLAEELGVTLEEFQRMIYDPYVNTDCMIIILTECRDNYANQNWHHVLMRYNLGPTNASKSFAEGVYSTWYSQTILDYAEETFGLTDNEIKLH